MYSTYRANSATSPRWKPQLTGSSHIAASANLLSNRGHEVWIHGLQAVKVGCGSGWRVGPKGMGANPSGPAYNCARGVIVLVASSKLRMVWDRRVAMEKGNSSSIRHKAARASSAVG